MASIEAQPIMRMREHQIFLFNIYQALTSRTKHETRDQNLQMNIQTQLIDSVGKEK